MIQYYVLNKKVYIYIYIYIKVSSIYTNIQRHHKVQRLMKQPETVTQRCTYTYTEMKIQQIWYKTFIIYWRAT